MDFEIGDEFLGAPPLKAFGEKAERKAALQMRQCHVWAGALRENEALLATIFRHKHKTALNRAAWTGMRIKFAAKSNGARREGVGPENGARQLGASAADEADQADNLSRPNGQRDVGEPGVGGKAVDG